MYMMEIVLHNLLSYALKFTESGLALTMRVIGPAGGAISVESMDGKETAFIVSCRI